jgi:hypothetical protein
MACCIQSFSVVDSFLHHTCTGILGIYGCGHSGFAFSPGRVDAVEADPSNLPSPLESAEVMVSGPYLFASDFCGLFFLPWNSCVMVKRSMHSRSKISSACSNAV